MLAAILALSLLVSEDVVVTTGNLNINQVFNLLQRNGATPTEAATLAGISVWEAGGGNPNSINPQALNDNARTQDYSVGLFQFNFRAGNFNAANPMASTRGGYTPGDLLGSLDAQAQSALALLRGSASGFHNWTTYTAHLGSIQGYVSQLLGGANVGGGTTDIPAPEPIQTTPPAQSTTQGQGTTTANAGAVPPPTGMKLSFPGSMQHIIFQFLLVIVGIALLLGGIYLLGSRK